MKISTWQPSNRGLDGFDKWAEGQQHVAGAHTDLAWANNPGEETLVAYCRCGKWGVEAELAGEERVNVEAAIATAWDQHKQASGVDPDVNDVGERKGQENTADLAPLPEDNSAAMGDDYQREMRRMGWA